MSRQFETLYKRTKTGAIQEYKLWVDTHPMDDVPVIMKSSGQLDGKHTIHSETVFQGRNIGKANETTPEQQALLQAKSDWKKKRDEGYKSLKDLGISKNGCETNHSTTYMFNGNKWNLSCCLEQALPQFNTDASGNIKPMLAPTKPWKHKDKKNKYPAQLEKKFDGVRAMLRLERQGPDVVATMLSRSGKEYTTVGHITNAVLESSLDVGETVILDGEIYKHGWTLQEINRAVKKYRPGITEQLEFWVYDLPLHGGKQMERTMAIKEIVDKINHASVQAVESWTVYNDDEVKTLHDTMVADGYEGAMLKQHDGTYQQGQRSSFWTKVKMFDENEFRIIGHELGQRGAEDLIFICEINVGGEKKSFAAKMKGSRENKQEILDNIGEVLFKPLTVKHFGYTEYGIPFLPIGKAIRDYE